MKKFRKLFALLAAAALVVAMSITAFAEGETNAQTTTGTITITPPTGTAAEAQNVYKIYKVFDATVDAKDNTKVSYTLCTGDTLSQAMINAGFSVDTAGNVHCSIEGDDLTEDAIAAIAAYVTESDYVTSATSTGTDEAISAAIPYGYYYIATSTGTVVTIDSNNDNPTVDDKNTVPEVKKTTAEDAEEAIAQVGTSVEYKAVITVGKGAKNYVFHDVMGEGLSYNNDAEVSFDSGAYTYQIKGTPDEGDTLTITFQNDIPEGVKITIKYSATITSDALQIDPATNTAKVTYGDATSSNYTPDSEVKVYNAMFTVFKVDENEAALDGAGFVIKNSDNKYYKIEDNIVSWVDSEDDATELITEIADGEAKVSFTGLGVGSYTLVEKTVPDGYNKADDQTFNIAANNVTAANLSQVATVSNYSGSELPSTGGIGTTIFYIIGSILVIGAGVLLVTKKRMDS